MISYHFAGKDDLIRQVVHEAAKQAKACIRPRILADPPGPRLLWAYIESNLAFMREHRNNVIAMVEIARNAEGRRIVLRQETGRLRPNFDAHAMAIAIRAAIAGASPQLSLDSDFDADHYASKVATKFHLATRIEGTP